MSQYSEIQKLLGADAENLLGFKNPKISKEQIHQPRADWVDFAFAPSDRSNRVLANLQRLYGSGRLANTGYVSILPVDQGIEHSAGELLRPAHRPGQRRGRVGRVPGDDILGP
ncbi:MAG: hypothetical protein ACKORB_01665, partial [Opitutia bacterium]